MYSALAAAASGSSSSRQQQQQCDSRRTIQPILVMCVTFRYVLIGLSMMNYFKLRTAKKHFFHPTKYKIAPLTVKAYFLVSATSPAGGHDNFFSFLPFSIVFSLSEHAYVVPIVSTMMTWHCIVYSAWNSPVISELPLGHLLLALLAGESLLSFSFFLLL